MFNPYKYKIAYDQQIGEVSTSCLYEYILAENGVYARGSREGLQVCIPIMRGTIRGLTSTEPYVRLDYPKVPEWILLSILNKSREVCLSAKDRVEALFHLFFDTKTKRWKLETPIQVASIGSVSPVEVGTGSSYEKALIEIHSHHDMSPVFSYIDNEEEQGFRLYGVIGHIFKDPMLRLRVGLFGNFYEIPANVIFEVPEEIKDALWRDDNDS
jgi:hypothetical protein